MYTWSCPNGHTLETEESSVEQEFLVGERPHSHTGAPVCTECLQSLGKFIHMRLPDEE